MKKRKSIVLFVLVLLFTVWFSMFIIDYLQCSSLKEPIFVISAGATADDGGSGIFYGLGYTVMVEKHIDADNGVSIESVEMRMFGKIISASIT